MQRKKQAKHCVTLEIIWEPQGKILQTWFRRQKATDLKLMGNQVKLHYGKSLIRGWG